jgi:hypothetical protein
VLFARWALKAKERVPLACRLQLPITAMVTELQTNTSTKSCELGDGLRAARGCR